MSQLAEFLPITQLCGVILFKGKASSRAVPTVRRDEWLKWENSGWQNGIYVLDPWILRALLHSGIITVRQGNRLPISVAVGSGDVEVAGQNLPGWEGCQIQISIFLQCSESGQTLLFHPPLFFLLKSPIPSSLRTPPGRSFPVSYNHRIV